MSRATIIAISSRLKESSDGLDYDKDKESVHMIQVLRLEAQTRLSSTSRSPEQLQNTVKSDMVFPVVSRATSFAISIQLRISSDGFDLVLEGESSNRDQDFVPAKELLRRLGRATYSRDAEITSKALDLSTSSKTRVERYPLLLRSETNYHDHDFVRAKGLFRRLN